MEQRIIYTCQHMLLDIEVKSISLDRLDEEWYLMPFMIIIIILSGKSHWWTVNLVDENGKKKTMCILHWFHTKVLTNFKREKNFIFKNVANPILNPSINITN